MLRRIPASDNFSTDALEAFDASASSNKLRDVNQARMIGLIRQIGVLSSHASAIFDNMMASVRQVSARIGNVSKGIAGTKTMLDSAHNTEKSIPPVTPASDFKENNAPTPKENKTPLSNLFTKATRPGHLRDLYNTCEATPDVAKLNRFAPKGVNLQERYSNPMFFFRSWVQGKQTMMDSIKAKPKASGSPKIKPRGFIQTTQMAPMRTKPAPTEVNSGTPKDSPPPAPKRRRTTKNSVSAPLIEVMSAGSPLTHVTASTPETSLTIPASPKRDIHGNVASMPQDANNTCGTPTNTSPCPNDAAQKQSPKRDIPERDVRGNAAGPSTPRDANNALRTAPTNTIPCPHEAAQKQSPKQSAQPLTSSIQTVSMTPPPPPPPPVKATPKTTILRGKLKTFRRKRKRLRDQTGKSRRRRQTQRFDITTQLQTHIAAQRKKNRNKKISANKDGYMLMAAEDKGKSASSQENHVRTILETMREQMGYEQEDESESDWDDDDF